jgi:hypothetical protein
MVVDESVLFHFLQELIEVLDFCDFLAALNLLVSWQPLRVWLMMATLNLFWEWAIVMLVVILNHVFATSHECAPQVRKRGAFEHLSLTTHVVTHRYLQPRYLEQECGSEILNVKEVEFLLSEHPEMGFILWNDDEHGEIKSVAVTDDECGDFKHIKRLSFVRPAVYDLLSGYMLAFKDVPKQDLRPLKQDELVILMTRVFRGQPTLAKRFWKEEIRGPLFKMLKDSDSSSTLNLNHLQLLTALATDRESAGHVCDFVIWYLNWIM